MNPKAIEHAEHRLKKARQALDVMEFSTTFAESEEAWSAFLSAASTVYSKLEQGSKTSGTSQGWFGRKKHERKNDELLCYIHHARNSDEHGIAEITAREGGGWALQGGGKYLLNGTIGNNGVLEVTHMGGPPPKVVIIEPSVRLVPVKNERWGDVFSPPTMHLGEKLPNIAPLTIAKLAIDYLENLVAEAAGLPTSP